MNISRTVAKMESAEKDDPERIDFNEKDEEQNKVQAKNININKGRKKDENKRSKEKANKRYSAISDILARFRRNLGLGPPVPSETSICDLPPGHAITLHCIVRLNKEIYK